MTDKRRFPIFAILPVVAFVALAALFGSGMLREDPNALPSTFVGRAAPPLDTDVLGDASAIDISMLAEPGIKLVNFWASWCGPCRIEHPVLADLAQEGVPILGVNYKDDPDNAMQFLTELGDPYLAVGADPKGLTAFQWGVYGIPETFVINGAGEVVLRFAGPVTPQALEHKIRPAMEAARQ